MSEGFCSYRAAFTCSTVSGAEVVGPALINCALRGNPTPPSTFPLHAASTLHNTADNKAHTDSS